MLMGSLDRDLVTLSPVQFNLTQSLDMNLFIITDYKLVYVNADDVKEGITMTINLKRKITSEMMTTYFPSLLLMLITFATTFFKPFFFEAALSVNLTTMLVMTTIFISKMEGLPPTSDIKMIDYWLILFQLVPFTEVVLLTAMEYLREEDENTKSENDKAKFAVTSMDEGGSLKNKKATNCSIVEVQAVPVPGKRAGTFISHLRFFGE